MPAPSPLIRPKAEARATRRRAERRGRRAERLACLALQLKGYRILERRRRSALGEIDILARRGEVLAIVEVKARPSLAAGVAALGPAQRRRLIGAARAVMARFPNEPELAIRFDLMVVRPWRWPTHLEGAFDTMAAGGYTR